MVQVILIRQTTLMGGLFLIMPRAPSLSGQPAHAAPVYRPVKQGEVQFSPRQATTKSDVAVTLTITHTVRQTSGDSVRIVLYYLRLDKMLLS